MPKLPKAVTNVITSFEKLPGIGPKSAQRLAFYLLHTPEEYLQQFADTLLALKRDTVLCSITHNIAQEDPDPLFTDVSRDRKLLCIVEQPLDLLAIEESGHFNGVYHVLHGVIDPLNSVGPEQLFIYDIPERLDGVEEVILATNPTMEGEATALFIKELIEKKRPDQNISLTRIGHGLPIGADIEYADAVTLSRALQGRTKVG